jgi:inosine/xanthosine triphosphate pyrophosphatase family protein
MQQPLNYGTIHKITYCAKKLLDELAKYTNRKAIFVTTITLILNNQIFFLMAKLMAL